jgi:hypothetical protein
MSFAAAGHFVFRLNQKGKRMDTVYTVDVYDNWHPRGFATWVTKHTRVVLSDGSEALESQYGNIRRVADMSRPTAETLNDARQLLIDQLYERIVIIRKQISELRTEILNDELEVQHD